MAERRMLSMKVLNNDDFLDLPFSAQMLYVQATVRADEDGFCSGIRSLARTIGASAADIDLLVKSRFLLMFDGVAVVKHFRMANSLQVDRVKPSVYPEIASQIYIKENKAYTDHPEPGCKTILEYKADLMNRKANNRNPNGIQMESKWNPSRAEQSIAEQSIAEQSIAVAEAPGFHPDSTFATATADRELQPMNGTLGQGVVFLTDEQVGALIDRIGMDAFDYYVDKLANFILDKGARVKNHYQTILSWYQQDTQT